MKKQNEQMLKNQIVDYLNYNGYFAWKTNTGTFFFKDKSGKSRMFKSGIKGCSDILAIKGGKFYAIECKIKPNKLTPEQDWFLKEIEKHGGIGVVAYKLEDIENMVKVFNNEI
jgi:hypothetical protein